MHVHTAAVAAAVALSLALTACGRTETKQSARPEPKKPAPSTDFDTAELKLPSDAPLPVAIENGASVDDVLTAFDELQARLALYAKLDLPLTGCDEDAKAALIAQMPGVTDPSTSALLRLQANDQALGFWDANKDQPAKTSVKDEPGFARSIAVRIPGESPRQEIHKLAGDANRVYWLFAKRTTGKKDELVSGYVSYQKDTQTAYYSVRTRDMNSGASSVVDNIFDFNALSAKQITINNFADGTSAALHFDIKRSGDDVATALNTRTFEKNSTTPKSAASLNGAYLVQQGATANDRCLVKK